MSAFKKFQEKLEKKGYSHASAGAIAYTVGEKKYGKKTMKEAAEKGVSAKSLASGKKHAMAGSGKRYK